MKIGLLGLIMSDFSDVNYDKLRFAADLGFHGIGAHLTVPASTISDETAARVKEVFANQRMPFLQLWGPYPCIITPDETVRRAGVEGARDLIRLAAKMGVPESGVRPTSLSPRGEWWPHADNYKPETEDRLVRSLCEILETAEEYDITVVLETHVTTTLNTPETIRRVIERTGSKRLKLNLDPCNFVGDLQTAFNLPPMLQHLFDVLGDYIATVHLKDFLLEDRFVVHITETVIGTGLMDFDTILRLVHQTKPDAYVVIEHLPISLIPLAKRNLTQKIKDLGLPLG
ncbi:MAG: sugar phosphate isomerase/epimerase [Chloroflexi bacterium]|uniref:sugar phosphate isomerase/epimerase family protein n=1 Tax=Candidatus Flexifilum breve TaxID=3140694 RepID=UPI003136C315|nr:sugar phosphate isomerase/epimerase [Chloroflexota bacterium]MBK9751306.1 sugar phosphate isomerase/epimerase [Chloroflexota bacterium]